MPLPTHMRLINTNNQSNPQLQATLMPLDHKLMKMTTSQLEIPIDSRYKLLKVRKQLHRSRKLHLYLLRQRITHIIRTHLKRILRNPSEKERGD
jgi:hypothetical protein